MHGLYEAGWVCVSWQGSVYEAFSEMLVGCHLRLCIYTILNMVPQGLALFAPRCGSWGAPNRGTSMRSYINPHGHELHPTVLLSNTMVSRMLSCAAG